MGIIFNILSFGLFLVLFVYNFALLKKRREVIEVHYKTAITNLDRAQTRLSREKERSDNSGASTQAVSNIEKEIASLRGTKSKLEKNILEIDEQLDSPTKYLWSIGYFLSFIGVNLTTGIATCGFYYWGIDAYKEERNPFFALIWLAVVLAVCSVAVFALKFTAQITQEMSSYKHYFTFIFLGMFTNYSVQYFCYFLLEQCQLFSQAERIFLLIFSGLSLSLFILRIYHSIIFDEYYGDEKQALS